MANFSTNQVRHFYAVSDVKATAAGVSSVGDVFVGKTADNRYMYFSYKGKGGLVRSDLIPIKNILDANTRKGKDMVLPRQKVTVTLDSTINSGSPVSGQDYILHINFRKIFGQSEDVDYVKVAAVHVDPTMNTASLFYKALALNVVKNFARESNHLIDVYLATASDPVEVTTATDPTSLAGTYTGVEIRNADDDWELGLFVESHPEIVVSFGSVVFSGQEYDAWGVATEGTYSKTGDCNGRTVADLEYFCMGERGDQYRQIGWPNFVKTEYMIDATKSYDIVTIHYAFVDDNEGVQKSEKDIQIAVEAPAGSYAASSAGTPSVINTLIAKINTATGAQEGDAAYIAELTGSNA